MEGDENASRNSGREKKRKSEHYSRGNIVRNMLRSVDGQCGGAY